MLVDAQSILYKIATDEFMLTRDSIDERIKLQKTIYLLQVFKLQFGYSFSWDKYGPYSEDLVRDSYRVLGPEKDKYEEVTSQWKFSENSRRKFDRFKDLCGDILRNTEQLELVASVDFVRQNYCPEATRSNIADLFKEHKKVLFNDIPLTDEMICNAFDLCQQLRSN